MTLTRQSITDLLATNDKAVCVALCRIRDRQTADEQVTEQTRHHNNRGFMPQHAKRGTSMADWYRRTGFLTPKQIAYWRKTDKRGIMRIALYWAQLVEEAQTKEIKKQQQKACTKA